MYRHLKRILIAVVGFALLSLAVIAPVTTSAAPAESHLPPDFLFSVSWPAPTYSGYLDRGGDSWVRYPLQIYGWAWCTNHLRLTSYQGWSGTVNLEVLNLPAGVISEIPTSVFVPSRGSASVPIRFLAPANAPLTTVTVTLRGTSGAKVKTADVLFTIVDQLPPLPN
jgi:hypothetical protein